MITGKGLLPDAGRRRLTTFWRQIDRDCKVSICTSTWQPYYENYQIWTVQSNWTILWKLPNLNRLPTTRFLHIFLFILSNRKKNRHNFLSFFFSSSFLLQSTLSSHFHPPISFKIKTLFHLRAFFSFSSFFPLNVFLEAGTTKGLINLFRPLMMVIFMLHKS